jgi:predicted nucleic acid-binding protein
MASVTELKNFDPQTYPVYFFDANIWIALIKQNNLNKKEKGFDDYINLFEAIVHLNSISDPKVVKKIKCKPRIAITSMLLSEIINAYLRRVAMPAFLNGNSGDFKKDYRENIYSDYDKQLKIIISDILSYSFLFQFVDDAFSTFNHDVFLSSLNRNLDFNDLYYLNLMEINSIAIVTHDKDFNSSNVNILTSNYKLLKTI